MAWVRRYPIPSAFVVLSVLPLIVVALSYERVTSHAVGWIALALVLGLTLAVVPMRRRWAWWIVLAVQALTVFTILWEAVSPLALTDNILLLGLLLSPQMRGFIAERQLVSWQRSRR